MSGVRLSINRSALETTVGRIAQRHLTHLTEQIADECADTAPVGDNPERENGRLKRSIIHRVEGTGLRSRGIVTANTEYAAAVHNGTRPHEIRPRTARVLRFPTRGGIVFAPKVNHPGTSPNPWMRRAASRIVGGR